MTKATDYRAVEADTSRGLTQRVRELIGKGFEPLGGLAAEVDADGVDGFLQAMVRREPESVELGQLRQLAVQCAEQASAAMDGLIEHREAVEEIERLIQAVGVGRPMARCEGEEKR